MKTVFVGFWTVEARANPLVLALAVHGYAHTKIRRSTNTKHNFPSNSRVKSSEQKSV